MPQKYNVNDTAFIVESNMLIREVIVKKYAAGLYLISFADGTGGIKVRESRLFPTKEAAEATLPKPKVPEKQTPKYKTPWDWSDKT